ncbi:tetraspanin-31-B isoform X2, partial [Paramuricea clavata]
MKSCGFGCTRQTLISLNVMYIVVGLILIILPVYSKFSQLLTSWPIIGGAIASGVFLMLIAIAGIYGAARHNQIILFFYMIILILIFILLFAFSCAALAISDKYEHTLLSHGWNNLDNETKGKWEKFGNCCGFDNKSRSVAHPCHGQTKSE